MSHLLTALLTIAGTLVALALLVIVPLTLLAVTPRKVMRRRRQVARFTRQLDTRLAELTTWKGRPWGMALDDSIPPIVASEPVTPQNAAQFLPPRQHRGVATPTTWKARP